MAAFGALLFIFWTAPVQAVQRQTLKGHVPAVVQNLTAVDRLPASQQLSLSIGLPLRNEEALNRLLEQLHVPSSPQYHRYVTPQEFTAQFGPTEQDYQQVIQYLQAGGLRIVRTHSNRLLLDVTGSVSDIESAFATRLKVYPHPKENRTFFAPEVEPSVEPGLSILDISGLDNYVLPHPASLHSRPQSVRAVPNGGSAPGGSYRGNDFRAAYAPGVALAGTGQSIGLLEFDGYHAADITAYETAAGLPNVPVQNVLLNGFNGNAGANNNEVALDIEVSIAMAPGISSLLVYEGTQGNTMLNQMALDNQAKQLSSSWTFGINSTTENIYRQFSAQGQSMLQASGDDGAYTGAVPTPADNPNLTVVGGTTLSTSGPGGTWVSETTWNWSSTGMGSSASSGGVSTAYPIPAYQKGIDMSGNQGSTKQRNLPDVAMTADNIWVVWDNGSKGAFGGTSAATPLWAGFIALVNQQSVANGRSTIGLLNPVLYPLGKGTSYNSCFHDITTGNNTNSSSPSKFYAATGYDLCTGWGTPSGQPLINALAGGTNLPPAFNSSSFTLSSANATQPYSGSISNQASDPNPGDPLKFAKLSGPNWLSIAPDGTLSGTPENTDAGANTFTVSVAESAGMSNSATMYIPVNGAPIFTADPFLEPDATAGQSYLASLATSATNPNPGDTLRFAKVSGPAWLTVASSGTLSGTPANSDVGTNAFVVSATSSDGLSASATLNINVNGAPFFHSSSFTVPAVSAGQPYSGTITNQASDPNPGTALTFAKLSGPSWLIVAPDGSLSGTPSATDIGTNTFSVSVTDSTGLSGSAIMNIPVVSVTPLLQIDLRAGGLVLSWTGGTPPFQLQVSTNFPGAWQNVGGLVTNYSATILPSAGSAIYRILAGQ